MEVTQPSTPALRYWVCITFALIAALGCGSRGGPDPTHPNGEEAGTGGAGVPGAGGVGGVDVSPPANTDAGVSDDDMPDASDTAEWSENPRDTLHLFMSGHSLFNLWMPAMLSQIAEGLGRDHHYNIQMGLGSSMSARLSSSYDVAPQDRRGDRIAFDVLGEIADAQTLADGRKYDTLMLTEIVPLLPQIRARDTLGNTRRFYDALTESTPDGRVLLYDSWEPVPDGDFTAWINTHQQQYVIWECVASAVNRDPAVAANPIHLIPGGIALAHVVDATLADAVPGVDDPTAFFEEDIFHLSNLGNYVIALAAYTTLYARSPQSAPHELHDPWNQPLPEMPSQETASALQALVGDFIAGFHANPPNTSRTMPACRQAVTPFCEGHALCEADIAARFAD